MPAMTPEAATASLAEFNVRPDGRPKGAPKDDSGAWCYWRRPDGWISLGQANPHEFQRQTEKGMVALLQYGKFSFPYDKPHDWYPERDPWWLLLNRGGVKEFPLDQVVQLGWHQRPPYPDVVFPQLAGQAIETTKCPVCLKIFSSIPGPEGVSISADDLLIRHQSVMHKDRSAQDQLIQGLTRAQGQASEPITNILKALVEGQAMMMTLIQQQQQVVDRILIDRGQGAAPKSEAGEEAPLKASIKQ